MENKVNWSKYFSRTFFSILLVLQFILWMGKFSWIGLWFVQDVLGFAIFWTAFVPLLPFTLLGAHVFNPDGFPTFIGWVILIILQSLFALFISGIISPLVEGFIERRRHRDIR